MSDVKKKVFLEVFISPAGAADDAGICF